MELALSLGDHTAKPFPFLDKSQRTAAKDFGFCVGLEPQIHGRSQERGETHESEGSNRRDEIIRSCDQDHDRGVSSDPPLQLDLLPFSPVPRNQPVHSHLPLPWLPDHLTSEPGSTNGPGRRLGLKRLAMGAEDGDDAAAMSSPNSAASSFRMDFFRGGRGKRELENEVDNDQKGASSRASDEDENGLTRKKLRLSKEQSAFLEESFKEHNTLNPFMQKQKLALAKQLNLRPRQVEVWFQNRRARTKLKQTEVDCEYLKRCCETLTEENRRLQKELQELRALKASQPFFMQLPATTLTMCPSCERVASTSTTAAATPLAAVGPTNTTLAKPRMFPFTTSSHVQTQAHKAAS